MEMSSPLAKTVSDEYVEVFRALAEPIRIEMLSNFESDECACTTLEDRLPISKSTISYHIKILSQAGLLDVRKEGRFYHYTLRREVFDFFVPGFLDRLRYQRDNSAA